MTVIHKINSIIRLFFSGYKRRGININATKRGNDGLLISKNVENIEKAVVKQKLDIFASLENRDNVVKIFDDEIIHDDKMINVNNNN